MKVTIAIPCYNAERWLEQCLESALEQTVDEKEIIVVDDGSTDNSVGIARQFGKQVRVLQSEHQGATRARNLALEEAKGEWVQFLDADDYLDSEKIATQLAEVKEDADVIYSPVWIETWTPEGSTREASTVSPNMDIYTQWIRWHIPQTGGALWRREMLKLIGGWKDDQPCCQEHELYLRALKAALRFKFAPTPGAVYRVWSDETLCRKDPLLVVRERTKLMDDLLKWLGPNATAVHRREIGRACLEMSRTWARYDMAGAKKYHDDRMGKELIHLSGPAAPFLYRMAYRMFGFAKAEKLARTAR